MTSPMTPHLEKIAREDDGFGRSAASPSLTSPSLANEPATPSAEGSNEAMIAERLLRLEGSGDAGSEAIWLHNMLREFDWYALAGTYASRLLHERLTRLVSSDDFFALIVPPYDGSQSPVASDGEVQRSETTEPKPS